MASYNTDEKRWCAIQARDQRADTEFLYGVITTGIYCYPSCPSRQALKDNTRFFDCQQQARQEGFRACKRCLSDQPPLATRQQLIVEQACRELEASAGALSIELLATSLQISRFHLQKLFKRFLGLSPKQYAKAVRARQMESALNSEATVTDALYSAGYNSASAFYVNDAERLGMPARRYKRGGEGLKILYAFGKTRLGGIIVATTDKGICCVLFGDTQKTLKTDLASRFPLADLTKDTDALAALVLDVISCIEQPKTQSSLPIDIQGTVFQEKVWRALRTIKPGTTATYSDVASMIGKPTAARAVATACASNPIAVLVPCHRVVRASGELSGYRWGVARKRMLIDSEADDD